MNGIVDGAGRALLRLRVRNPNDAAEAELDVWIDTGFTGDLVLPQKHVSSLGLPIGPAVKAALADGSETQLDTYTCLLLWFDEWKRIEVVANQGQFPLLGVGLLLDRKLVIDYAAKTLTAE
jgi:clan AA aspartic protease